MCWLCWAGVIPIGKLPGELVISPVTVRSHIENLSEKLGVRGRRRVVARARELGLLPE